MTAPRDRAAERVDRAAERVADRLRVLGPRWAARDHAPDRAAITEVRVALQRLADLAADARAAPRRPVPELRLHALGDQILVLAREVAPTGGADAALDVLETLRDRL